MPIAIRMNRKLLFFTIVSIGLYLSAGPLPGETVMVSVGDPGGIRGDEKVSGYFLSALEDGIMEEFFLSGHIVFNSGAASSGRESRRVRDIGTAKEGGASRLLLVDVHFMRNGGTGPVPEKVEYFFMSVSDQRSLAEGTFSASELEKPPTMPMEEFCARLGKETARRVLGIR